MAITGKFTNLPLATLETMRTNLDSAYSDILTGGGQSYAVAGRNRAAASMESISRDLAEVNYAINILSGTTTDRTYANCNVSG